MSLSAMLAHVGHAVNDFSLDQDFQLRIEPWGNSPEKRPEAFRVFLQLTDLVLVWYDVLVKDIYVWIVCAQQTGDVSSTGTEEYFCLGFHQRSFRC